MTKTLTALIAAGTLATATAAVPTIAQERCIGCGIGGVEYPIAPPGYVYYPAYYEPLPMQRSCAMVGTAAVAVAKVPAAMRAVRVFVIGVS